MLALGIEPARGGVATELPDDHPLLRRHESLHRLLLRATHPDPRYRFGSADEMAEQLDGVRREVLAVDEQRPRPGPSGGLLRAAGHVRRGPAARPLRPWPARARPGRATGCPNRSTPGTADAGDAGPDDWRHRWSAALAALAGGDLDTARAAFDALYSTFPGELAPKLALAAVAECAGDDGVAQRYYELVAPSTRAGPTPPSGVARTRLRAGRRADAVSALLAVPASSSGHVAARRAAVEATLLRHDTGSADDDELRAAATLLEQLDLDPLATAAHAGRRARRGRRAGRAVPVPGSRCWAAPGRNARCGSSWNGACARWPGSPRTVRRRSRSIDRANSAHPRTLR